MNNIYQYSTMGALVAGRFEGTFAMNEVLSEGNYGIGTMDGLNGELIVLDGHPYLIEYTGKVRSVSEDEKSPYASMINFEPTIQLNIKENMNKDALDKKLLEISKGMNYFHAVKITGKFKHIKARSAKKQAAPYPKLVEAVKEQGYFDFQNTEGTLFGFYTPKFITGIGVGGYHVHYLNNDCTQGGHVFDYQIDDVKIEIALQNDFVLKMPETEMYPIYDLSHPDMLSDIEKSE